MASADVTVSAGACACSSGGGSAQGIAFSQGGGTSRTSAAKGTSDGFGFALERIGLLFTAAKISALALELLHCQGRELGGGVMLWLIPVDFMDGDGGVDHSRLDGLLLDNGLDHLVNVVVDVLTRNGRVGGRGVLHLRDAAGALELGSFGLKPLLHMVRIAVLEGAVLDGHHAVCVLLREHLTVLDNLDRGVIVVLVHLAIDGCLHLITLGPDHLLMFHGRLDYLVYCGVVPSVTGKEAGNCLLCLVHVGRSGICQFTGNLMGIEWNMSQKR